MAKEVLLMDDVADLGKAGSVVKVADGYARNYLLPKGLAAPVTQAALRRLETLRKEREELARLQLVEARAKAERLAQVSCTIRAKTADGQRLYGSVSASDIVASLEKQGIVIDRHQLELEAPLKEVGMVELPVRLHPEVTATLKVWVVEE